MPRSSSGVAHWHFGSPGWSNLAATTGDLYTALLEPEPDEAPLDGAGGIIDALCAVGGPAKPGDASGTACAPPRSMATCGSHARRLPRG